LIFKKSLLPIAVPPYEKIRELLHYYLEKIALSSQ
jgi:hypothetical protein